MKGIIKKIDKIHFGLMSPEQIREMSVCKIEMPDTYDEDGYPIESGLMDSRMGIIDPSLICPTCGERGGECQGHFGMIELARPVVHVGFGDDIHKILRSTCSECGRVLLDDDEIAEFTEKMQELQKAGYSIEELVKEVYKICKERKPNPTKVKSHVDVCPHCGAEQYDIKIVKPIDLIEVRRQYDEFGELITDDNGVPITEDYDLTASEVREKLQRIPDEDAYVLGVNPEVARPEWMVLTVLPVPPVTVRPTIALDTGERSEDDLTHKLVDILRINQRLIENMDAGAPQLIVEDLWKLLQYHVTTYFDNDAFGVPPARHRSGRPLKTLAQRLRGKEGRFRSNLIGKRVNFFARTVIGPDPNISINEVGVPEMIAKELTVPTYVNEWNIDELREAVANGSNVHPGANYISKIINNKYMKVRVLDSNKEFAAENLVYGDVVMRHLKDGDIVLFNRSRLTPRFSMMAHEVRVLPYKTFRLNPSVCPPYNVSFDGAEMKMNVIQNEEARAEIKSLMRVQEHIISPGSGRPITGAINDHISGAYLLTREGSEFPEDVAYQMIRKSHLLNNPNVDKKHLKRKNRNWTGKELFSLLLPDDLNMNYKAEICRKCENCQKENCQYDAFVVIKDGQLTHGAIDGTAYGSSTGKILDVLVREYGATYAKEFLDNSTNLAIDAITRIGITTSSNDFEIPEEGLEVIDAFLDKAEQEVDKLIATYEKGLLHPLPGRSAEETLEMRIVEVLGETRDTAGEIAEGYLTMGKQSPDDSYDYVMAVENHSVVMARTGARASMLNLAQITACVGQQSVRGGRITRGYLARPLPHFRKHELGARAKGFVHSSYKEGLDPVEFFFHTMGGRENLVKDMIGKQHSIYTQRRLVNALQDLYVKSDGLVTDNKGHVIQSVFGEEGIDPAKSDFGHVANLDMIIDEMRIKNNEIQQNNRINRPSFYNESDIKKPVESKKNALLESKTRGYRKSYRRTENIFNSIRNDYDSLKDDLVELNNNLDKLEKKVNKIDFIGTGPFTKEINRIHLNLEDINSELKDAHHNIQEYNDKLASLYGKSYVFSSIYEVDAEITKLNSISRGLQLAEIDRIKVNLDKEILSFDSINKRCNSILNQQKKKTKLLNSLKSKINKLNSEISENSDLPGEINNVLADINGFDVDFTEKNSEIIDNLVEKITSLAQDSTLYLQSAINLKNKLEKRIGPLDRLENLDSLDEKTISKYLLLDNVMPIDIIQIRKDYDEQMIIYHDLKFQELEFSQKKAQENQFKSNYKELYDLGFTLNDVNEEILHNYTKFKEFREKIVFKFKITQHKLSEEDVTLINQNIIGDIVNQEISNFDYASIYEEYIERYMEENSSFISDEELKENYKELYDLGFTSKDVDEEILNNYIKFNDYKLGAEFKIKPMLHQLSSEDVENINKNIIEDIGNKNLIGDLNFDSIYDNYSANYKAEKRLEGINWDEILKNIDLGIYSDETIEYCKKKVIIELRDGQTSQNHIKSRFKVHINKKMEMDRKLKNLEELKLNPNKPNNKLFLTKEELDGIYLNVGKKIQMENPDPVYTILENEINILIKINQSKARRKFERYYKDMDSFTQITGLYVNDAEILISRIENSIDKKEIKAEDIDEDYIRKAAIKLKNDMDYVDRKY